MGDYEVDLLSDMTSWYMQNLDRHALWTVKNDPDIPNMPFNQHSRIAYASIKYNSGVFLNLFNISHVHSWTKVFENSMTLFDSVDSIFVNLAPRHK